MTDGCVEMAKLGVFELPRGLQKEHVEESLVLGEPEVPDPSIAQP